MASRNPVTMNRYLKLIWLLASSLFFGFVGFMLSLTLMLPFILRYSSDYIRTPQWVRLLMGVLGYGIPILFFTANFIRLWRWADRKMLPSDVKNEKNVRHKDSIDSTINDYRDES